jgi:ABC-type branched-subunit amino acid transport system substrate-binding protein
VEGDGGPRIPYCPAKSPEATLLRRGEAAWAAGRADEAWTRYRELLLVPGDDERKGLAWRRVGEILLSRGDSEGALAAADNAARASRGRYHVLSSMELRLRALLVLPRRGAEVHDLASYLLDQGYPLSDGAAVFEAAGKAEGEEGKITRAVADYGRAIDLASPAEGARIAAARDALLERTEDLYSLRQAAEAADAEDRPRIFLALGKAAARKGFNGMAAWGYERAARAGGEGGNEAAERLFRLEKILSGRPRIVGIVPLSGKLADAGFAVLAGAEASLLRRRDDPSAPVLKWVDTGGLPDQARREYVAAAADRSTVAVIGPLSGEEGKAVAASLVQKGPPVFYLGQKAVAERPPLYAFGLTPQQEARAVLSWLARTGRGAEAVLLGPDNGYGRGYAEAVALAAKETGVKVGKNVLYPPDTRDFSKIIRASVAPSASRRKGAVLLLADRWERVFLLASQLRYFEVRNLLAGFSGWNDPALARKAKEALSGAVFSADYSDSVPGSQGDRFRTDFRQAAGTAPTRFEAMGYDCATLLQRAAETGEGRPSGEGMRAGLARLRYFTGVTGSFTFGAAGEMKRKVTLLRSELGTFTPVAEN